MKIRLAHIAHARSGDKADRADIGLFAWNDAGYALIERHVQVEQIRVAADIDSALLADDLPPDAYTDPGFQEYLRLHGGF